ncbi:mechanosensitive ion channel family protein [Flavisolibacter ginsenosidimutans]|uniref:Mechanosensitive ion channel family protein n=1 Tax=Flavisolibacter ginsenosidimutans TaxID=661481 RepID=A0A5B8UDP0_9BACT|nr:mechanosensitive ion channel family protein [Flavisolibacter ginsenosidimutans]QEC54787.1 mechanosensitive ion channel family protein [Flavisolibacter ginsenosidimutans]
MDVETNKERSKEIKNAKGSGHHKAWVIGYVVTALVFIAVYFLLQFKVFGLLGTYRSLLQRLSLAGFVVSVVLIIARVIIASIAKRSENKKEQYNVIRLIRLLSVLLALFIVVTFLFAKWYTAAVSLGLFSLILGFALQTPISSLIGWFYIIIRTPYRIGDRIQVGTFTGDVVEIGYLDTTLWEFHGDYLSNDVPSGRLIRFPNTLVLQSQVYNYSWRKFPFIWNEIPFQIAYESDFDFVEKTVKEVATRELGDGMKEAIEKFKELVQQTPVDELEIKEYPFVVFRVNANTWVEVVLTYLVPPKKASGIRSRLIKSIIRELLKEPDKVLFPKSNSR